MKDYDISLKVRCESKPQTWLVDVMYEQLNQKINEDILYWDVKDLKPETNNEPTKKEVTKDEHND